MARLHPSAPPKAAYIVMAVFIIGLFLSKAGNGPGPSQPLRTIVIVIVSALASCFLFLAWKHRREPGDPDWKRKWDERNPW
jgi:hypothetical protein